MVSPTSLPATVLNSPRARAVACFVALYVAVGAGAPYLPIYYRSLGMTLDVIGLLASVVALCALVSATVWGLAADRLHATRLVLPAACLSAAIVGAALGTAVATVAAAMFAILYWLAYAGIGPVLDAKALEVVTDRHGYSVMRAWGSAAFVASSVGVGVLIQAYGLRSLFVVLVLALVVTAVLTLGLRPGAARPRVPHLTRLGSVLRERSLLAFLAAVLLAWTANSAINAFLSIYLTNIGAPGSLIGAAWAIGAAVEIPLMVAFPVLARRFGVERLIVVGAGLLVVRALILALVADPYVVSAAMALHGGGFALLLVGGITHVAGIARPGSAATAQGVLAGVVIGLAPAIGPGLGGLIAANVGLNVLFLAAAVVGFVGAVALAIALGLRGSAIVAPAARERVWNAD